MRHAAAALAFFAALGVAVAAAAAPTPGGPAGDAIGPAAGPATEHAAAGHGEHEPQDYPGCGFGGMNVWCGFIGEKAGVEPDPLWRSPGMPVPFAATLVNAAVLFWVLYRFGKKPVVEGLAQRKKSILAGMEEASRMKSEAARRLGEYEAKLERIDDEIERVRREMKQAGEAEHARVIAEARERHARMERDARLLVVQEIEAAHARLLQETVDAAVKSAETILAEHATAADQQRLADEYVAGLARSLGKSRGAQA